MNTALLNEVKEAYADCWLEDIHGAGMARRNLDFKASEFCSPAEAKAIMEQAVPHGYNGFHPSLLEAFPDDCKILIAREGSVCMYVHFIVYDDMPSQSALQADEYDEVKAGSWGATDKTIGTIRIWWD